MRYFAGLGLELESSRKWASGMARKTTSHFSFLKAEPDSGSMEAVLLSERWKTGRTFRRIASNTLSRLQLGRTFPRYSSNLACQKSLTCCLSTSTRTTYYAWEGLRSFRPRVVVVEYNAAIPPDVDWKVRYGSKRTYNGTQNFGASLKAFEILGRQFGYSLVGCEFFGVNAFFVRDDLLAGKFAEPLTSENHYEPPRYSLIHRRSHPPSILDRTGPG